MVTGQLVTNCPLQVDGLHRQRMNSLEADLEYTLPIVHSSNSCSTFRSAHCGTVQNCHFQPPWTRQLYNWQNLTTSAPFNEDNKIDFGQSVGKPQEGIAAQRKGTCGTGRYCCLHWYLPGGARNGNEQGPFQKRLSVSISGPFRFCFGPCPCPFRAAGPFQKRALLARVGSHNREATRMEPP